MANYERFFRKVEKKYGGRIADLLNVKEQDVRFDIGPTGVKGAVAVTRGQDITFGGGYLRGASRKDIRGAVIHELAHAYGAGEGKSEQRIETLADYARYKLNKNEDPGWDPSREVLAMAGRGNKVGDGNRMRNTQQNKLSKAGAGAKGLPPLSPQQNAAYFEQLQAMYAGYQNQLMALRQERVGLRQGFRQARTDIRGELIGNLSGIQNENIERGTYGGSAGYQQEIGARAEAEQARTAAKQEMLQGLAYNRIAVNTAATDYAMQAAALQTQKLAQQQEALAAQLEQNAIVSGLEQQGDALTSALRQMIKNTQGGPGGAAPGGGGGVGNGGQRGSQFSAPGSFPGTDAQWRRLSPDEKFRYLAGYYPGGGAGTRRVSR